jgi:tetratricopeptide (TPR) repeat protein
MGGCQSNQQNEPHYTDDSSLITALLQEGSLLHTQSKFREAITSFDKALKIDPKNAKAYRNKGNALDDLGDKAGAIKCFDEALRINPEYAMAYHGKGNALYSLGDKAGAIKCYDEALRINPELAQAYNNKGVTLDDLGDKAGAIKCYDEALRINPENALVYCNRGKVLFDLGQEAEALESFNKAASIAETGNLGSNLSEGNKAHINQMLNEDRAKLIKKLTEFASIQVETVEITPENEVFISEKLKLARHGSISKAKGLKLLQKALISESVDAIDSKNNTNAAQFAEIFRHLEEAKKEKLAYNEEVRLLRAELEAIKASKADRTEVSHAIKMIILILWIIMMLLYLLLAQAIQHLKLFQVVNSRLIQETQQ